MIELIERYETADTREERDELFADLLHTTEIVGMVRRQTNRFEARGLYDAQSIIYLWLWNELENGEEEFHEGALVNHLKSHLGSVGTVDVLPGQHSRYRGIQGRVAAGGVLEDELAGKMSLREYQAIYRVDASSAVALESISRAPDLQAEEDAELAFILNLCGEVLDDDQQGVFQYRYWLDETDNLSWERVAEELSDEGEKTWTRKQVAKLHGEGIESLRQELGIG